jgi:glycosyltransferase involved in cell wall biosynthesis
MVQHTKRKRLNAGLVSVIIPCYNAQRTITQAIESVLWQTHPKWECIIVDDGSTDDSPSIVRAFARRDRRIKYVRQQNKGLAAARNKGVSMANGKFIQFLDADDLLLPDKLQLCLDRLLEDPSADVVYCDYALLSGKDHYFQTLPVKIPGDDPLQCFLFEWNIRFIIPVHAFLFGKKVIMRHPFETGLRSHAEDVDCWIRIAADGTRMSYVDSVGVIYRTSHTSSTSDEHALISAKLAVLKRYESREEFRRYARKFEEGKSYLNRRLAIACFMNREFREGLKLMKQEWKRSDMVWKIKMLGWFVLLFFFSKRFLFQIRERIVSRTKLRWGGWKHYKHWEAPDFVRALISSTLTFS